MARELVRQGKVCPQCRLDEVGHWVCPTCGRVMKRKLWHMNLGTGAPCDEVPKPEFRVRTPLDRVQHDVYTC